MLLTPWLSLWESCHEVTERATGEGHCLFFVSKRKCGEIHARLNSCIENEDVDVFAACGKG